MNMMNTPAERPNRNAVQVGYGSVQSYELLQRGAMSLASSSLVPEQYRKFKLDKEGNVIGENPQALANCMVALNMASRMSADPLMVMQNLYIIEGRPSWSAQWIIGMINQSGRYSPLRFKMSPEGPERTVEYEYFEWADTPSGKRARQKKIGQAKIKDRTCIAWARERDTNEELTSPEVSMEMAVREGWLTKNGSKWLTMPELMLRYRSAAMFGRLYAPELLMGMPMTYQAYEAKEIEPHTWEVPNKIESPRERVDWAAETGDDASKPVFIDEVQGKPAQTNPEPATVASASGGAESSPASGPVVGALTPAASKILGNKLAELYPDGAFPTEFCKHFEIESFDALPMSKVNEAFGWIAAEKARE